MRRRWPITVRFVRPVRLRPTRSLRLDERPSALDRLMCRVLGHWQCGGDLLLGGSFDEDPTHNTRYTCGRCGACAAGQYASCIPPRDPRWKPR